MASRKTDPEPFPVRGTPTGYRDSWDVDDRAIVAANLAEHERLIVAARETAAAVRRGKDRVARQSRQSTPPANRSAADSE